MGRQRHVRALPEPSDVERRRKGAFDLAKGLAEGYRRDGLIRRSPRLAEVYALYDTCRTKQLVIRDFTRGDKVETRVIAFPTGYSFLPYPGALLDQPVFLVQAFEQFMRAERAAAASRLSS